MRRPIACHGPEPRIWSNEGAEQPAWRIVLVYETYSQEFWFGNEKAAQEYCARAMEGAEDRASSN